MTPITASVQPRNPPLRAAQINQQSQYGGSVVSTGSVYAASLTVTPLVSGDSKGTVAWSGPGSPAEWTPGGVGVTFLAAPPAVARQCRKPHAARCGTTTAPR